MLTNVEAAHHSDSVVKFQFSKFKVQRVENELIRNRQLEDSGSGAHRGENNAWALAKLTSHNANNTLYFFFLFELELNGNGRSNSFPVRSVLISFLLYRCNGRLAQVGVR